MTKPKLHAILVGINDYHSGIRPLQGCHNDVQNMQRYLTEQADYFELNIHPPLLDKSATKDNIVKTFRQHFQDAAASDTVLLYFSGHGCRESADPTLWPNEYDQLLEGWVCYKPEQEDDADKTDPISPHVLLVDKELRYLISEFTQQYPPDQAPHVLIIADCCHSGDGTRKSDYRLRRVERVAKQRPTQAFIFPPEWLEQRQKPDALGGADYPEGAHVHLGACQDRQVAKETTLGEEALPQGVFTHCLLAFLRQNQGNLSYYDLQHRLKAFIRFRHEQVPQVYIPPQHQDLYYRGFLNRLISATAPTVAQIYYDEQQGWLLNKGALDSVSRQAKVQVNAPEGALFQTAPTEVQPDLSVLQFSEQEAAQLDTQKTYTCQIEGLLWAPINVCLDNTRGILSKSAEQALKQQLLQQVKGLNFVETPGEDIYSLHVIHNEFRLSQNHNPYQPIVLPLGIEAPNWPILGQYLRQIWHWNYVKNLQSEDPDRQIFQSGLPLQLSLQLWGKDYRFHPQALKQGEQAVLNLPLQADGYRSRVRLYAKNRSPWTLWFCPLYLDGNFSVKPLLKNISTSIAPQQEILIRETDISLKDHFLEYNWAYDASLIKVLVSTQDNLQVDQLLIDQGLPLPPTLVVRRGQTKDTSGFGERSAEAPPGWLAQSLELMIPNPEYNVVNKRRLEAMRRHGVLKDYVEGIWG